jgi:hypothetical protein
MKRVICILTALLVVGCNNTQGTSEAQGAAKRVLEPDRDLSVASEKSAASEISGASHRTCSATDVMKLMKSDLQRDFFAQLDSARTAQYPNNDQEIDIFVDVTPQLLDRFLKDINKDSLLPNRRFDKKYHFNIAPAGFADPAQCRDRIEVVFNEDQCSFRIVMYNTCLVGEEGWCTESTVVYVFELTDDRILRFWRNEAG